MSGLAEFLKDRISHCRLRWRRRRAPALAWRSCVKWSSEWGERSERNLNRAREAASGSNCVSPHRVMTPFSAIGLLTNIREQ